MELGFSLPVSGAWATADNVVTVARRAEELGYASLWTFQRVLAPRDADLPPVYHSVLDPLVTLGFAAAACSRPRLGTAVLNAPFVAPAMLAKQLTTLDVLSGGRAVAGLGLGWLPQEFAAANVPFERRGARMEEYLACLAALWGPQPVTFEGEFYQVPTGHQLPGPTRPGGPTVLLGGTADAALERAGRLSSGWISSSRVAPGPLHTAIRTVRQGAERAGRDPAALEFVCRGVLLDAPRTRPLTGTLDQVAADLPELAGQGVTELFVDLNFDPTVGNPDVPAATALRRAFDVLEALAPHADARLGG